MARAAISRACDYPVSRLYNPGNRQSFNRLIDSLQELKDFHCGFTLMNRNVWREVDDLDSSKAEHLVEYSANEASAIDKGALLLSAYFVLGSIPGIED